MEPSSAVLNALRGFPRTPVSAQIGKSVVLGVPGGNRRWAAGKLGQPVDCKGTPYITGLKTAAADCLAAIQQSDRPVEAAVVMAPKVSPQAAGVHVVCLSAKADDALVQKPGPHTV